MSTSIRIALLCFSMCTLTTKILAHPYPYPLDTGELEALLSSDTEEVEVDGDQMYIAPWVLKRSGFWSSHPSDYTPMRRPTGQQGPGRGTKKSEASPYHPIPRSVNISQKNQRSHPSNEDFEEAYGEGRDKRQSPGSFLLMKLGRMSKAGGSNGVAADVNRRLGRRRA